MNEFIKQLKSVLSEHCIYTQCTEGPELAVSATREHDTVTFTLPVAQLLREPEHAAHMVAFYVKERLDKVQETRRTEMRAAIELAINTTAETSGP